MEIGLLADNTDHYRDFEDNRVVPKVLESKGDIYTLAGTLEFESLDNERSEQSRYVPSYRT